MHKLPILLILFAHTTLANPQPHIVGGTASNPESRNFMAYLFMGKSACGGAMLGKDWVVTAAHCVYKLRNIKDLTIIPGGLDLSTQTGREEIPAKRILIHEKWKLSTMQYDIALIQLEYPSRVGIPISIVDNVTLNDLIASGEPSWAFGRGSQTPSKPEEEPDKVGTNKLFAVNLPLVANDVCEDLLKATDKEGGVHPVFNLTQGQLCAGGVSGKGICNGDSGGPLLVQKSDGKAYLAGLASWVIGCAHPNSPANFTRIPAYLNGIKAVIRDNAKTLTGEPDLTAVLDDNSQTPETETSDPSSPETASGGSAGGALSIAWLPLVLLRRRRVKEIG